jgi:hypothetical protein
VVNPKLFLLINDKNVLFFPPTTKDPESIVQSPQCCTRASHIFEASKGNKIHQDQYQNQYNKQQKT